LLGVANGYPCPAIVEAFGRGWDFVWIDGQHGQYSHDVAIHAVRAGNAVGVDTVLRVPTHDPGILGMYMDMLPAGLMAPMVNTAEQASAIVDAIRFAPLGNRSFGGRRPIDCLGREYYKGPSSLLVVQIETPQAVENAERIIAVEGVDALFLGPDDLKLQLGIPVDTPVLESAPLEDAMRRVGQAARAANKFAGGIAGGEETLTEAIGMGYQLLVVGGDVPFIRTASRERLEASRRILESARKA
jgi:2-keto-3-deoxy-L-rhamnonate aldolase RhmA